MIDSYKDELAMSREQATEQKIQVYTDIHKRMYKHTVTQNKHTRTHTD